MPLILDSYAKVETILKVAVKRGIKILSLTEHDSFESYFAVQKMIEEKNLDILLIPGIEVSSKGGHILGYGIKHLIPRGLSIQETIDKIHEQGGVVVAAHPYGPYKSLRGAIFKHNFDALEISPGILPQNLNRKTVKAAKKLGLPYLNSRDAHSARSIVRNVTYFSDETQTIEDVLKAIKTGNFRLKPE